MVYDFCEGPLWDPHKTWNTTEPDLTPCFQETILVWVPAAFLWALAPFELYSILHSTSKNIPWTILNILKAGFTLALIIISLLELIYGITQEINGPQITFAVDIVTPLIKLVTFVLALALVLLHRKKGVHTSGALFIFWLLLSIGALINYRSAFLHVLEKEISAFYLDKFVFSLRVAYVPIVISLFVLSWFADSKPEFLAAGEEIRDPSPEYSAPFISRVTFWWFNSMVLLGWKKPLKQEDMWSLDRENQTEEVYNRFARDWTKVLQKAREVARRETKVDEIKGEIRPAVRANLLWPIIKSFWPLFLFYNWMKLIAILLGFVPSIILNQVIAFIQNPEEPVWHGVFFAIVMFSSSMVESILNSQYEFGLTKISMRMKSALVATIYRKALILSSSSRKDFTTGEIVNLMSVDTQRIVDYVSIINVVWSAPIQIGLAIYLIWQQLGTATLAGLAVMILMIPINGYFAARIRAEQIKLMKHKDKRTKLMNEVLNGMKILKLYAWEPSFLDQVSKLRKDEIQCLYRQSFSSAGMIFAFGCVPILVGIASFGTFVFTSSEPLDANKAFVSLTLFNLLRVPLALLPMCVTFGAMLLVSLRRINKFLSGDELDESAILREINEQYAIQIEKATFAWGKDEAPTLKSLSTNIAHGKLVAVVGQVGCGKSSLLSALLGDMEKIAGYVNVSGSLAYVPQQAWIQNATLRDNILFNSKLEDRRYQRVIKACALEQDLSILSGGDLTEIGEKGINLSGGQKQRVSLARAVYADSDIYLLDDPLSAVDSHVGRHIFDQVIGPKGCLAKKTRILVTHKVSILKECDEIIVLRDGSISEAGSYQELLDRKGDFADFLVQYLVEKTEEENDDPEDKEILEELKDKVRPELERALSWRSNSVESDHSSESSPRKRLSSTTSRKSSGTSGQQVANGAPAHGKGGKPKGKPSGKLTEAEEAQTGSVKWKVYWSYLRAWGKYAAILTFVPFIFSTSFNIATSLWLSAWADDSKLIGSNSTPPMDPTTRLGVYSALGIAEGASHLISTFVMYLACLRASKQIHDLMLRRIMRAPMSFFDTTPLGRILNRFTKDLDTADLTIRFNLRMLLSQTFRTIIAVILIALQSEYILIALVPLSFIYYLMQKFYISTSRQLKRIESTTRSPIYTHFSETVTGSTCIRGFSATPRFVQQSDYLVDVNNSCYYPSLAASRWLALRLEFLGYTIVFITTLLAVLTRGDSSSAGLAGLSISYALTLTGTLNMLVRASADVETNIVSIERCLEYYETPVEADYYREDKKPREGWPDQGVIQFKSYSTRYREGLDLVLKLVSLDIKAGERVGIVGRTGAGKSSLTLALFRLIEPAEGTIMIDNVDVKELGLFDLRSRLTIIPQDPVLFTGTLRNNLDPFDKYSDAEVWTALELAHLKDFVAGLEAGLSHNVTEGGDNLSAGQKQLVCLARALLRKSRILVLDEATAAVDLETDDLIQATIRKEFKECTIVTIAHRLNTIMDYDRILVLSEGQIAEFDQPQRLLENKDSIFYSMAKDSGLA